MKSTKTTVRIAAGLVGLALVLAAAPAAADSVIADDCIIIGSQCIGFDCVNGEVFGFDTLRLKENNLRMHFDDTSTAASFPDNEWRLIANDSANGGAEYFAIEDATAGRQVFRVFAGARSNALVVDAQGDVGIGTSTPTLLLHLKEGDSPALRLEQDNSSGFTPHTWDVAGNEVNFFIRDVTSGSKLPIRSRPGAPTSSLDIAADGDVGMGTATPDEALHIVRSSGNTRLEVESTAGTAAQAGFVLTNTAATWNTLNLGGGGAAAGNYVINQTADGTFEAELDADGNLEISGTLTTTGSCSIGCDAVFSPEYVVESIDEHAFEMWTNRHLPAVGPTSDGPINISHKTTGMLNELEKAHIYIEQLHKRLEKLERAAAQPADAN